MVLLISIWIWALIKSAAKNFMKFLSNIFHTIIFFTSAFQILGGRKVLPYKQRITTSVSQFHHTLGNNFFHLTVTKQNELELAGEEEMFCDGESPSLLQPDVPEQNAFIYVFCGLLVSFFLLSKTNTVNVERQNCFFLSFLYKVVLIKTQLKDSH